ncbi:RNA polymerase-associated protein LEO1 [Candida viswanathii]|uniref:RNA polymerase-associated protein LEO1 n=1 Tax=Candida viswanathii TaxID=5486 RepID=A0A367YKC1_9ASCO|nr:RNA polymerase-associated protein LEO1 [Candida viswanathii]
MNRWRYHNAGNDDIAKQSNAHFVAWNDGSVSLKVGNEIYDVRELPLFDHLLVRSYEDAEILQSDSIISKTMNLLPATSAHRKILVKNITKKEKILNTITDVDPLEKQRIADENVRKAMKLKRQLESKRRLQDEKWERSASPGFKPQGTSYQSYSRSMRMTMMAMVETISLLVMKKRLKSTTTMRKRKKRKLTRSNLKRC